jgi:hypothetical protein
LHAFLLAAIPPHSNTPGSTVGVAEISGFFVLEAIFEGVFWL